MAEGGAAKAPSEEVGGALGGRAASVVVAAVRVATARTAAPVGRE